MSFVLYLGLIICLRGVRIFFLIRDLSVVEVFKGGEFRVFYFIRMIFILFEWFNDLDFFREKNVFSINGELSFFIYNNCFN